MRDDIGKLPLPKEAKAYARRSGLKAMMRQPQQFQKVNAMLLNPGKPDVFKNYDVGVTTDGNKPAPRRSIKEEAFLIVSRLLD